MGVQVKSKYKVTRAGHLNTVAMGDDKRKRGAGYEVRSKIRGKRGGHIKQ